MDGQNACVVDCQERLGTFFFFCITITHYFEGSTDNGRCFAQRGPKLCLLALYEHKFVTVFFLISRTLWMQSVPSD